jgi:hypothetical protein
VDIDRACKTIRENIKFSAKESLGYRKLNHHRPWFDVGCSQLLDERKNAEFQW